MRRSNLRLTISAAMVLSVAFVPNVALADDFNNTGPLPTDCVKYEEGDDGTRTSVDGSLTVVGFTWEAPDEDGEFHDFSADSEGSLISVKAGQFIGAWNTYDGRQALSNVVFCSDGTEPPTPPPTPTVDPTPDPEPTPTSNPSV